MHLVSSTNRKEFENLCRLALEHRYKLFSAHVTETKDGVLYTAYFIRGANR